MPQTTIYVSPRSLGAPDTRPPAVRTSGLARLFAGSPALAGVSLRVDAGRVVTLTGPNGAGKTTLLRILATAILPTFGSAEVDGLDVARHAAAVRGRVAYLSHATGLYDDLTPRENLAFAAALLGAPDAERRIELILADVGLTAAAERRVAGFSAGMRKRAALGRILLGAPSLVLLDEPYATLDGDGIALVDELLAAWRAAGVTVLVATHAGERLAGMADAMVRMDGGLVTELAGDGVGVPAPAEGQGRPARVGVG